MPLLAAAADDEADDDDESVKRLAGSVVGCEWRAIALVGAGLYDGAFGVGSGLAEDADEAETGCLKALSDDFVRLRALESTLAAGRRALDSAEGHGGSARDVELVSVQVSQATGPRRGW